MEAMLAEASTVAEAAPLPPQYQTNYREEFQYSGPTTVRYVEICMSFARPRKHHLSEMYSCCQDCIQVLKVLGVIIVLQLLVCVFF